MNDDQALGHVSLTVRYSPVAVYYEASDIVEYVRHDVPCVHRRIDDLLTLMLDMDSMEVVGFKIKGFKNFYLKHLKPTYDLLDNDFISLVTVIERALEAAGDSIFGYDRKTAYRQAHRIAAEDQVKLHERPAA